MDHPATSLCAHLIMFTDDLRPLLDLEFDTGLHFYLGEISISHPFDLYRNGFRVTTQVSLGLVPTPSVEPSFRGASLRETKQPPPEVVRSICRITWNTPDGPHLEARLAPPVKGIEEPPTVPFAVIPKVFEYFGRDSLRRIEHYGVTPIVIDEDSLPYQNSGRKGADRNIVLLGQTSLKNHTSDIQIRVTDPVPS